MYNIQDCPLYDPFTYVPGLRHDMNKSAVKWTCVLAVVFILVMFSVGLLGANGGRDNVIRRILDDIAYYLRTGGRRPKLSGCKINLQRIILCKYTWMDESGGTTNDVPTWDDLRVYFPSARLNGIPVCPDGGTYSINRVGERPTCSIGGSRHSVLLFLSSAEW